jgi:hypothetical protein
MFTAGQQHGLKSNGILQWVDRSSMPALVPDQESVVEIETTNEDKAPAQGEGVD